jgi:hypothetical protein
MYTFMYAAYESMYTSNNGHVYNLAVIVCALTERWQLQGLLVP